MGKLSERTAFGLFTAKYRVPNISSESDIISWLQNISANRQIHISEVHLHSTEYDGTETDFPSLPDYTTLVGEIRNRSIDEISVYLLYNSETFILRIHIQSRIILLLAKQKNNGDVQGLEKILGLE